MEQEQQKQSETAHNSRSMDNDDVMEVDEPLPKDNIRIRIDEEKHTSKL